MYEWRFFCYYRKLWIHYCDKDIFIVSVPIHDSREIPRGILYGVVETDSFQIYKNTSMDKETDYMQIIRPRWGIYSASAGNQSDDRK